jgi:hypothetical protein
VVVTARDAVGNVDPTFTGNVAMAISAGTGTAGAALTGGTPVAAAAGVATFANLSINLAGTGYTLRATSGALTAGVSTAFNVTAGAATKLVFKVGPSTASAGLAIAPAVQVAAQDALGTGSDVHGDVPWPHGGTARSAHLSHADAARRA